MSTPWKASKLQGFVIAKCKLIVDNEIRCFLKLSLLSFDNLCNFVQILLFDGSSGDSLVCNEPIPDDCTDSTVIADYRIMSPP